MAMPSHCAWAAVRLALLCVSLCFLSCVEPYLPLSGDERPNDCNIAVELQGWYSCKETIKGRQRKPAVALHGRGPSRKRQFTNNIYSFETALPEKLLQRGIGPFGDTTRLVKLFHKLLTGQPASLSFIGGSITEGGGVPLHDRPHLAFPGKVSNWFLNTFPNSSIVVRNAAVGGVTSTYFGQCVDMFVPDEDVDLVFVDFTINDRASGDMGKSLQPDTPDRRAYEILLRKLLAFKQKPAVIVVHSWSPFFNEPDFFSTTEDLIQILVSYYGLQSVSMRNALWHPTLQRQQNYQAKQWLCDGIHPNILGHRYYADTIVGLLQDVALQAAIHPYVEPDAADLEVPPPMFGGNQETTAKCLRGDLLQQKVHQSGGWKWVDEGREGRHKYGYITEEPNQAITFEVDNSGCSDPNMEVSLGIGYLRSYERMGKALVTCLSGCTCDAHGIDGHNPASTASQEFWMYVPVTQSERCVVKIESLAETNSAQNKVKVTSLLLTCMAPEKAPFTG